MKDFRLSHISYSIRLITRRHLLFPDSQFCRPNSMPYGLPALHCIRRDDSFSTFHVIDSMDDLGAPCYAGGSTVPCRQLEDLQPDHLPLTRGSSLRPVKHLLILVGLLLVTTLKDIQLISPYHPSLGLNGRGFPGGFSCCHSNPIRYIVREASHPVISATVACSRRDRREHA